MLQRNDVVGSNPMKGMPSASSINYKIEGSTEHSEGI
jgi:hypothetical protein